MGGSLFHSRQDRMRDELLNESLFFGSIMPEAPLKNGPTIITISGRTHRSDIRPRQICRDHRRYRIPRCAR